MIRRWLITVVAALVLVVLIGWIARHIYWEETSVPVPLRGEARTNPFYTAQRLVEALGGSSERRDALGALPPPDAVIVLTHWHWSLIPRRREQLQQWVEAGGRVVIDGTLVGGAEELADWIGVAHEYPLPNEEEATEEATPDNDAPVEPRNDPDVEDADLDQCRVLEVTHGASGLNPVGGVYTICRVAEASWLTSASEPLWALHDGEAFQAIRAAAGRGSVTMVNATPFNNRDLLREDHAELFADAAQLRRGDLVVFVSEEEHASLLALIWRRGAPVVVLALILVGVALWRGSIRFGPMEAPPELSRRSLAEQIRGTGQFVMRAGRGKALHAAMVRALHEAAARRIPNYSGLHNADRIEAIGKLTGADAERLAATINYAGPRRAHDLKRDIALLDSAREQLINH